MAMLEVEDIHTFYGNIEALKGISVTVDEGEIVTLIGSNGAGKSTTLRSISGLSPPRQGSIRSPASMTVPWRGLMIPEIVRSVVLLPAPFEPISVTISPLSTVSEMPLSAWMLP